MTLKNYRNLAIVASLLLCSNYLKAQDELPCIQTDRPDQTECPFIVPKKHIQIETGFLYEKTDENSSYLAHPTTLLRWGLTRNFELRLIGELVSMRTAPSKTSGLDPMALGFKVKLAEEKGLIPATALICHLNFPFVATEQLKGTYHSPDFRFTMQHTLSESLSLSYNLGMEWDTEFNKSSYIYTLTTGYSISEKFGCYAELYGFLPQNSDGIHSFDAGITYLPKPNLQFDISASYGLTQTASEYYISLGVSYRWRD